MKAPIAMLAALLPLSVSADPATLERFAELLQGRYDTHAATTAAANDADERLIDSRQRIDAPALGPVVFYLQLNRGGELDLYRQRILVFTIIDGRIHQNAFTLKDPSRFENADTGDAVLEQVSEDDIEPMFVSGCTQVWTATAEGFSGYTDPATCRIVSSRTGNPRRIEAETVLTEDFLGLAERGYDDDMNQLFGTPQGERTRLGRVR
ncbi:MAG: chromophore lyase CpcT/CpeT [Pseudomonadota bacterium]